MLQLEQNIEHNRLGKKNCWKENRCEKKQNRLNPTTIVVEGEASDFVRVISGLWSSYHVMHTELG